MTRQATLDERWLRETDTQDPQTRTALLERAGRYAQTVDIDVDVEAIEWDISERAKRRAGCCRYNQVTGQITIVLTWAAFEAFGWEEFTGTIRHELVHAWEFEHFGKSTHGRRFKRKAAEVDAPLSCRAFTDARLQLVCRADGCVWRVDRHRASKPVTHPDGQYRCGSCQGRYEVLHVDSGERWRSNDRYERVRQKLGSDW